MANTYTSYDIIGKKEDISDFISNITPMDTAFTSMTGEDTVTNTLFQWQEDSLAAVNTANAQLDGFDATETACVPTVMRSNYTQIMYDAVKVAATTDAVHKYGRQKELAHQLMKKMKELKRSREAIMLSGQAAAAGSNVAARTMASFQAQVDATLLNVTGGAGTAMTETLFVDTLQELYVAGADPTLIMVPIAEARVIPAFASAAGRYRTIPTENASASKKLVATIDFYVSPFGEIRVVLGRYQLTTDYLIFNPSDWKKVVLTGRNWAKEPLAKIGDSERYMIVGEFSLKHANKLASAIVRKST